MYAFETLSKVIPHMIILGKLSGTLEVFWRLSYFPFLSFVSCRGMLSHVKPGVNDHINYEGDALCRRCSVPGNQDFWDFLTTPTCCVLLYIWFYPGSDPKLWLLQRQNKLTFYIFTISIKISLVVDFFFNLT